MNGSPTFTAAMGSSHRQGLLRSAEISRLAANLPRKDRHRTPRRRPAWWQRCTAAILGRRRVVVLPA